MGFASEQEEAIRRKVELYSPLLEADMPKGEFMRRLRAIEDAIVRKRLDWFDAHSAEMDYLRLNVPPVDKAMALIFGHQMSIDPAELATVVDGENLPGACGKSRPENEVLQELR